MGIQRVIVFIIHQTLGKEHVDMCLEALSKNTNGLKFDSFFIYNTNTEEVPNDYVIERYLNLNLDVLIGEIEILTFEKESTTLSEDTILIGQFLLQNYRPEDRVLLLKADILLSRGYLSELKKTDSLDKEIFYVAPLYNAKKSVSNQELMKMIDSDVVIRSSPEVFFTENETHSVETDFRDRMLPDFEAVCTDSEIKYLASTGKRDWSCPYLSIGLFKTVNIHQKDWGGWNAENNRVHFLGAYRSFIVHKYHPLRSGVRPGSYGKWIES
jgi:hypothetical protein